MCRVFYYLFIYKLYLFIFTKCMESDDSLIRSFTKSPEDSSYSLGDSVTLTCRLKLIEQTKIVVFRKGKNMKSEGCGPFDKEKYEMKCTFVKELGPDIKEFKFTIKKLSWEDRGSWECFYAQNVKSINIEIKVNPIFDQLQVNVVQSLTQKDDHLESTKPTIYRLMGRGSRTNPYNLREGASVNITCLSSCSYPETTHSWIYKNSTHPPIEIKSVKQRNRDLCNVDANKGMTASQSEVTINCSTLKIVGANIVMCSSTIEGEIKNSSVYILCPGGERPWELTTGEIVGVAVSVGIFVLLVVFLCLLIKRSRYTSVPGETSGNTYSSGVKV